MLEKREEKDVLNIGKKFFTATEEVIVLLKQR